MRFEVRNNKVAHSHLRQRVLAALLALCLVLSQMNSGFMAAYAMDGAAVTFTVGPSATAVLADGVLSVTGTGDTNNFTVDNAPFADCAGDIHTLNIEEGITYLGDYLFYGLGQLGGNLTLPSSIVGFGEAVFSGKSAETSSRFAVIENLFKSREVVRPAQPTTEQPVSEPSTPDQSTEEQVTPESSESTLLLSEGSVPDQTEPEQAPTEEPAPEQTPTEQPTTEQPEAPTTPEANTSGEGYTVERVVQQEIAHPDSLFFPDQEGTVICSNENVSFLAAAQSAGFRQTDQVESVPPTTNDAEGTEPINDPSADNVTVIYVDQQGGENTNEGTEASPVKTLDAAAALLKTKDQGGTVETNHIVIIGTYARSTTEGNGLFEDNPVPVTISGASGAILTVPETATGDDHPLHLREDFCLENIAVNRLNHIYGNGHNLTIGEGVTGTSIYLYGFGQGLIEANSGKDANVTVESGTIARIVGYARSNSSMDCAGLTSTITVDANASVGMIVAGSASGEIKNADVDISINGGSVTTLIGGNQGYLTNESPYSGKTRISVSGGIVTDLFGAGSGRGGSIPTYKGELGITVTGGTVKNVYGAGSAAYVVSDESTPSNVSINVIGGKVDNLFAAGKGWDTALASTGDKTPTNEKVQMSGSLTGNAKISIGGTAAVGDIYASGEGYSSFTGYEGSKSNAYLNGEALVEVSGGTVTGNVYGGGKGVASDGYEDCARVTAASQVQVRVTGGTVQGNVYGGGQTAKVECATNVNIEGGTITGSVYGGALGDANKNLVLGGSTVNMTGGWVRGNLYGGSELSDDGAALAEGAPTPDLVVTNLVGGTVDGNVFGGGYKGKVNGSTHLHVGRGAMDDCAYYQSHTGLIPSLIASALSVVGSVYAGGDFGGDGTNYDAITVLGTSHVYIDGTDYNTGGTTVADTAPTMTLGGAVFGSGASCDAGKTRLVTLENYGASTLGSDGVVTGATRSLAAIQRADRVVFSNSHVKLTGQSDAANTDQTALYSLNRIGDHDVSAELGSKGNGLVLRGGSTAVLESPATGLAALRSLDASGNEVTASGVTSSPNTVLLDTGTLLRVSYTEKDTKNEVYGPVKGYTRLLAAKSTEGYVYARIPSTGDADGGFVDKGNAVITFTDVTSSYRYWRVSEDGAVSNVTRQAVLTARNMDSGADSEGFSVAKGVVELPPADKDSVYTVKSVTIGDSTLHLAEAAKSGQGASDLWKTSAENNSGGTTIELNAQKEAIKSSPLITFGLYMKTGDGFANQDLGKVISDQSILQNDPNTVINAQTSGGVTADHVVPKIEFYLTYYNEGITASRDLGTVTVEFERTVDSDKKETTTANVQIVTKTTSLSSLEVDLYATQTGTYTGKLNIPSGASRKLTLTGVEAGDAGLVSQGTVLSGNQFSVSLQAMRNQGWQSAGLMEAPCDLGSYALKPVLLGTTDSRYEAPIELVLKNAAGFSAKESDVVTLTFKDGSTGLEVSVILKIHWEESVVASVTAGVGRQYNAPSAQIKPVISQESAMTAVFTLSSSLSIVNSWIELQNEKGEVVAWPAGAKLTLISGTEFYRYQATSAETKGRITLGSFTSMAGSTHPAGNISNAVTVILDLGPAAPGLQPGDYSLRLRDDKSADSVGANYTVNNSTASVALSGGGGLSKGTHTFSLTLTTGNDTRFADGTAVVLAPGAGESFPEGTAFMFDGVSYYPSGGKVFIPLSGTGPWSITMDTTNSVGLAAGEYKITAQVFPTGASAGNAQALSAEASFTVSQNPAYALDVSLDGANRLVSPGGVLSFAAAYSVQNDTGSLQIEVETQSKTDDGYQPSTTAWIISGNSPLTQSFGTQTITVAVPSDLTPGTYRLNFKLGDQTVPYNLIVVN